MSSSFFRKKPAPSNSVPPSSLSSPLSSSTPTALPRRLTLVQLILLGVSSTLGTGVFFVMAETVPIAGPGVVLSFVLAAITAGLTALCYAEVACRLPVSGSSYTFTYITMGEGMAALVAACLILEWGIAGAAVSVGWSSYLNELVFSLSNHEIPLALRASPFISNVSGLVIGSGSYFNLPAVVLVWLCTLLLLRGSRESASLNTILTITKVLVLVLFVLMVLPVFKTQNFEPFLPHGMDGVGAAAAVVFFSFVGLDAAVNASEEAINPQRNLPIAIIGALMIVTTVYVMVAVSCLGVQPAMAFIGRSAGLAAILQQATQSTWAGIMLAAGAVVSIFSVALVSLFCQARIYFSMARDGMLPERLARLDPHTFCPRASTLLSALLVTPLAALLPSHILWGMVSMGTLVAFIAVAASLMLLRHQNPTTATATEKTTTSHFKVPFYPITPLASIGACLYLIANLSTTVYWMFSSWMALALLFYLFYGRHGAKRARANQGKIAT